MGDKKDNKWRPPIGPAARKGEHRLPKDADGSQGEQPAAPATDPATVPDPTVDTRPDPVPDAGSFLAAPPVSEYEPPAAPERGTQSTAPLPQAPQDTMATRADGTAEMANPLHQLPTREEIPAAETPTDFSVHEMPSLHQGAYMYVNSILHDPRLEQPEYKENPQVQDALLRLEKVQRGLRRLPPYIMVTDHYAHIVKLIEDDLAAEGYTPDVHKPENFRDPGVPKRNKAEVNKFKSDMTYERNREMVDNLEAFFQAFDGWEANKPPRPERPSSPEGTPEHAAEKEAFETRVRWRKDWNDRFAPEVEDRIVGRRFQIKPGEVYEITQLIGSGGVGFAFEARNEQTGETVALKVSRAFKYNEGYVRDLPRAQIRETMALHTMTRAYANDKEYAAIRGEQEPPMYAAEYIGSKQVIDPGERSDYEDRAVPTDNPSAERYRTSEKRAHAMLAKRYAVLVMEQIKGPNLRMMLGKIRREGGMAVDRGMSYAEQLLDAVSWMHLHDVYHKDLKPGNIVIDADSDRLRIIDFGLALLPAQVERQAVRIKAADRIARDGRPPIYASSESSALNMTPLYAPDEELENQYYFGQEYVRKIERMEPEEQFDEVQYYAARRDNYAVGRMIYDVVEQIQSDPNAEDQSAKKMRYIASKLMDQNARISHKWEEHEYLTLQKAKEILADATQSVEDLPDYGKVIDRGRLLYDHKRELVDRALSYIANAGKQ